MKTVYFPLDTSVDIEVKLPNGGVVSVDLNEELAIHPSKLREELITQPSRYATWATVAEIARRRVEKSQINFFKVNDPQEEISTSCMETSLVQQYQLLEQTKQAFSYRKDALLQLLEGNNSDMVFKEYHKKLTGLRTLLGQKAKN